MMRALAESGGYSDAFFWSAVILALCLAMFFLLSFVRKKVRGNMEDSPVTGFTLADLRELHRSGKMSTDEFERAKEILLDATKAAAARNASRNTPDRPAI
jgi:uncharacterized membrane protein